MTSELPSDPYLVRRRLDLEKLGPGTDAVNLSNEFKAQQALPPMSVADAKAMLAVIDALEGENLVKRLEAFRGSLVAEDWNKRACLIDEAIVEIRRLRASQAAKGAQHE